jgi:hypothetical protein
MKSISKLSLSFLIITCFTFSKCKKEDAEPQLPPITTVGAMTFGCKVDGKVFVPRDGNGKPGLLPTYTFVGNGPGGGWFLNIPAIDWNSNDGVSIGTDSLLIGEGIYTLKKWAKGGVFAFCVKGREYNTQDTLPGELRIIKSDRINGILSGTFFFTAINSETGRKVIISEGRFDIKL